MGAGYIYVLTNPSFPAYVKIGYADDVEARLKELNRSECLPFAFRLHCTLEVPKRLAGRDVQALIDKLYPGQQAVETFDGKPRLIRGYIAVEGYVDGDGNKVTEAVTEDDTGAEVKPEEVTEGEDGTWTVSWSNLAVYKKGLVGSVITYTVKETKINGIDVKDYYGYEIDENGLEVTNTPVETGLDVTKEWDDDLADIAASVTAVTFRIESSIDGSTWAEVKLNEKPVTLTLERKPGEVFGQGSVDGLPAYDVNSKPYTYRAVETSITVNGKTVEVSDGKVGGYEITEKHTPGTDESEKEAVARDLSEIKNTLIRGSLAVEKEWTDNEDAVNVRPQTVQSLTRQITGLTTRPGKMFLYMTQPATRSPIPSQNRLRATTKHM